MAILPKAMYMCNAISIKSQWHSSQRLKNLPESSFGNTKYPRHYWAKRATLELPQYTTSYYRAIAIKVAWDWYKNKYEDQWNRMEDPDMNPHSYAHLIFDKGAKNIMGKRQPFWQMLLGKVVICLMMSVTLY
jgi:hypothetical protein